jgi:gallate dioxygenase
LVHPSHRLAFKANESASMRDAGLSEEEQGMIQRRDWQALIRYGASFFMLEKLAAVVGTSNLHVYAAMRGETLDTFLKTRNAPTALYSVAGETPTPPDWATRL